MVDWLISLESGKFEKYEVMLRNIFNKEGVNGSTMKHIDKTELRGWGIESFMDRSVIDKHIQNVVNNINDEGNNYNEEGKCRYQY